MAPRVGWLKVVSEESDFLLAEKDFLLDPLQGSKAFCASPLWERRIILLRTFILTQYFYCSRQEHFVGLWMPEHSEMIVRGNTPGEIRAASTCSGLREWWEIYLWQTQWDLICLYSQLMGTPETIMRKLFWDSHWFWRIWMLPQAVCSHDKGV